MAKLIGVVLALFISTSAFAAEYRPLFGGHAQSGLTVNQLTFGMGSSGTGAVGELTGAFGSGVDLIRTVCTATCYIAIAQTGSTMLHATEETGVRLTAGREEYFRVRPGETIAVIGVGAGAIFVHELTR